MVERALAGFNSMANGNDRKELAENLTPKISVFRRQCPSSYGHSKMEYAKASRNN